MSDSTRRDALLAGGAAAAGLTILNHAVAQEKVPGAGAADRASTIKITGMKTYWVGPVVYVKIETNHGISGWGDLKGVHPKASQPLVHALFELLDGENPTRIEYLWQKIYRAHRDMRGGALMVHSLAAIDIALWDIAGKLWSTPVYRLLGGPTRDRIRVYHTHKAIKVPPPGILIQLAAAIKPFDVLFIEEPAVPGNIEVFKRLKQSITIPLAAGERDRTIWEHIPYLHERVLDVLQPDACHTGGISQVKKIATLAEAYHVPLAPHCTASFLGIAASLHTVASISNFLIHEFYPTNAGFNVPGVTRMHYEIDKDGYVGMPPGPGLGVEVDEAKLAEEAKKPQSYRWPGAKLKDGSIADY